MATLLTTRTLIRAGTDQDGATAVTDAQLTAWISAEYSVLVRRLSNFIPDRFTKYTAEYTVASGASSFVIAETDLSRIREVQRKEGSDFWSLALAPGWNPELPSQMGWRQRGASTVDIFPAALAAGTYRVRYAYKPATLAADGDPLDLPDGAETAIAEVVSARVRNRFEEDSGAHERWRKAAWDELRDSLMPWYLGTSEAITDVYGRY